MGNPSKGTVRWRAIYCLRGVNLDSASKQLVAARIINLVNNKKGRPRRIIGQGDK